MGLPATEIHISINLPGGASTDTVVAMVNKAGTNEWWDFGGTPQWRTTGWTDNTLTLTAAAGISLTGDGSASVYAYGKATGLTPGDVVTIHVKDVTTGAIYFYGYFIVP